MPEFASTRQPVVGRGNDRTDSRDVRVPSCPNSLLDLDSLLDPTPAAEPQDAKMELARSPAADWPAVQPRIAAGPVSMNRLQSEYLDVARGVAAQLVLVQHAITLSFPGRGYDRSELGALGVLVFFLLSGFLITSTILARVNRGEFSATEFLISRFSRIFTPYVPAILLIALLDYYSSQFPSYPYADSLDAPTAIANLLMLQDYPLFQILRRIGVPEQPWFFRSFGSGRQFWTISIEWWIYVAAGLGTAFALSRQRLPLLVGVLFAVGAFEAAYHLVGGPGNCLTATWLVGASVALFYHSRARMPARVLQKLALSGLTAFTALFLALALAGARFVFVRGQVYDAILAVLVGVILFIPFFRLRGYSHTSAPHKPLLGHVAFHSFSLYLTHTPLLTLIAAAYPDWLEGWSGLLAAMLLCNVFALVFACAFEVPHRRVRRFLLRVRQQHRPRRSGSQTSERPAHREAVASRGVM